MAKLAYFKAPAMADGNQFNTYFISFHLAYMIQMEVECSVRIIYSNVISSSCFQENQT